MFCFPPHPLTRPRLAAGADCRIAQGRADLVVGGQTALTIADAAAVHMLAALMSGSTPAGAVAELAAAERQLLAAGVLAVEFLDAPGGAVVARLSSSGYAQPLRLSEPAAGWRLHRHAVLQPDGSGWRLTSPLSRYELHLASAGVLDGLMAHAAQTADELDSLLARAMWAGALTEAPADACEAPAWSHEDLMFHAATRRHADHRPRGKRTSRPDWAPPMPAAKPGAALGDDLRRRLDAVTFESVLAGRRSVRGPLPPPTLDELRDLLRIVQAERGDRPTAPCRSYPMAGGLQSLDFHLVTAARADAPAVLHRFDAATGGLQPVAAPQGSAQRLLDEAAQGWGASHGLPCALMVITARLPELAARYEATAYRLALLEAGCATQLLTEVATALGLATCVLGNGDSELFALASGLSEWQAPAIAEIAVAGRLGPDQR